MIMLPVASSSFAEWYKKTSVEVGIRGLEPSLEPKPKSQVSSRALMV